MARKIFGKIQSEWGIPPDVKMRVIVWDADIDDDDHIGTTEVGQDGHYSLEFEDKKWDWSPFTSISKWRPDVYLVVEMYDIYNLTWKEIARSKIYSDLDTRTDQEINLFVDFSYSNSNTIYGYIKTKSGDPVTHITVSAWDEKKTLFRPMTLDDSTTSVINPNELTDYVGSSKTNKNGEYRILFDPNKFALTLDKLMKEGLDAYRRPDIFIKVHNLDGKGIITRSQTRQNVICQLGCRIDVTI